MEFTASMLLSKGTESPKEKCLFFERITAQSFVASKEDIVKSFLELSARRREEQYVTINDLIDILNKNTGNQLKKIDNEFDFAWYPEGWGLFPVYDVIHYKLVPYIDLKGKPCLLIKYEIDPNSYHGNFSWLRYRDDFYIPETGWIVNTTEDYPKHLDLGKKDEHDDGCIHLEFDVEGLKKDND